MSVRKNARAKGKGIHNEPAYMLHRYEWSESSLIVELFTRNLGRVAVVAKGVRRPSSGFRSILLPFQPLLVSLSSEGDIRTLRGVEWAGGYTMPTGEPLLLGYYLNELVMRFLVRDEPQSLVFDAYAQSLAVIALQRDEMLIQAILRTFELILLQALGVLPDLDRETLTGQAIRQDKTLYTLDRHAGLTRCGDASEQTGVSGECWLAIYEALGSGHVLEKLPLSVINYTNELKLILRTMISNDSGREFLHTRELMRSLQKIKTERSL